MTDRTANAPAEPRRLERPGGHTIAYRTGPGKSPGVIFLGGFASDMTGTKATALDEFCAAGGRAFTRFDYLGHGASSGKFTDGTIGRWAEDAIAVLDGVTQGPQVLVGSSMGGWIMLLAALARPERVAGLVGVSAAPDFVEDLIWGQFDSKRREELMRDGFVDLPSDYDDRPYRITRALVQDSRKHLLLRAPIAISCPVRLLQGIEDADVPWRTALRISEQLDSDDVDVTLVKGAGHALSEPADLERLWRAVSEVCALAED